MELENLFSKLASHEEKKESFLALEISPGYVCAAIWQPETKGTKITALGSREKWDGQTIESLTTASDASLAAALENLPEEPNKIIFGLPETWVSQNKIAAPRLNDLKLLCQKLDLKPLGFVVTTEAIIQYLKTTEGTPLSGILVHLKKDEVLLTLVKVGKNLGMQVISRSENLGDDLYEGIARFGKEETFPARILLYDGKGVDLETANQSLLDFEWPSSLFLHFPKTEILEEKTTIKAITVAGGEEIAASLGLKKETAAKDVGFLQGKDVMEEISKEREQKDQPLAEKKKTAKPVRKKLNLPKIKLPKLKLPQLKIKLPRWQFKRSGKPLIIIIVFIFFLLISGGAMAFYWLAPRAEIVLFVKSKNLEQEYKIGIDPDLSTTDLEKAQIPGEVIEVEVTASQEKETSGEKMIGEKAKGEVTIYNFTSETKSFPQGTIVIGPDDLSFSLDVDIVVDSASSSFDEEWRKVDTPGKIKAAITALEVGPEHNLASETEFDIKGQPITSFRGKNSKALSGGTSRQVKVVSTQDRETLLEELSILLEQKVKEELISKAPEKKTILEQGILTSVVSSEFDNAVGAEAEKLKLELTTKAKTLTYFPDDLEALLLKMIVGSIPKGFVSKEMSTEIKEGKIDKEGKASLEVALKAGLLPDLDLEEVKTNLVGKDPQVGKDYLHGLPNFVKAEVMILPKMPSKLQTFPRLAKNIQIQLKIEE